MQSNSEAGRFKSDLAALIAPARVDGIIAKVRADAEAQNLEPTVAEATFRAMIAAFEIYEQAEWVKRQEQEMGQAMNARCAEMEFGERNFTSPPDTANSLLSAISGE